LRCSSTIRRSTSCSSSRSRIDPQAAVAGCAIHLWWSAPTSSVFRCCSPSGPAWPSTRCVLDAMPWLNLHPSKLPRWRGAAPIERAIMAGEDDLAACVILLVEALDAGPIAAHEAFTLGPEETAVDAYRRALEIGAPLLGRSLASAAEGGLATVPQIGEPTYAAKLGRDDLALDPEGPWSAQHARVRALAAASGARLGIDGGTLSVWRTRPAPDVTTLAAGALALAEGRLVLGCADGALELVEVQPAGKRRMTATDWARGIRAELPVAARP
jgi:methionyl-tRNA formyltransferase